MAQVINTNVYSLNAQRNLNQTSSMLATSLQRLSSGLRINSAKDDAAGLAIASRFTAQIRGYNQGVRNSADAISLAQTAEGAYDEMGNNLQRIRELAVQAANATNSTTDRQAIQTEITDLKSEISRVTATQFNGVEVIGSNAGSFYFQVGPNGNSTVDGITVQTINVRSDATFSAMQASAATVWTSTFSINEMTSLALSLIGKTDAMLQVINTQRAILGATQNRFESVIRNGENISEQLSASRSRIEDADFAKETAALTKAQILQQAGTTVLSQANAVPQSVLALLQG